MPDERPLPLLLVLVFFHKDGGKTVDSTVSLDVHWYQLLGLESTNEGQSISYRINYKTPKSPSHAEKGLFNSDVDLRGSPLGFFHVVVESPRESNLGADKLHDEEEEEEDEIEDKEEEEEEEEER